MYKVDYEYHVWMGVVALHILNAGAPTSFAGFSHSSLGFFYYTHFRPTSKPTTTHELSLDQDIARSSGPVLRPKGPRWRARILPADLMEYIARMGRSAAVSRPEITFCYARGSRSDYICRAKYCNYGKPSAC